MSGRNDWRILSDSRDKLGESPQWNHASGELYWVDFEGPIVRRLSPDGTRTDWSLGQFASIGSLVLCEDGRLLAAADCGLYHFDPQDGSAEFFADPNQGRVDLPYNDAKVDPHGNYWVGNFDATERHPRGVLYCFNGKREWRIGDSGFICCDGPAFSPEGDVLYFSDSEGRQSLAYDLDPEGKLSRRRVFQAFSESDGLPDGCCVDAEGCVWIAMYGGGKVLRLFPSGESLETLALPVRNVTSCCLGGNNLRTLYVTTARSTEESTPLDGALFAVDVRVPGIPEPFFGLR